MINDISMEPSERKLDESPQGSHNRTSSPTSSNSGYLSGDESSEKVSIYPFSGTTEDEFIQASLNLTKVSELTEAVERFKEMVLETKEYSEERKWLVRHLIELRLRLEEAREAEIQHRQLMPIGTPDCSPIDSPTAVKERDGGRRRDKRIVLGHHFVLQAPISYSSKCDKCCGNIWSVLHPWYLCSDCSYKCHTKCLDKVERLCAHVRACETPYYSNEICPEVGLAGQRYCCYDCKTHITFKNSWVEPRQCDYDGRYYCANCHWNNQMVIPARVVHNWDFIERPVCCSCAQFLRILHDRPVINIDVLNPQLFSCAEELATAKELRSQIMQMKQYLITCTSALKEKVKKKMIWSLRSHLVDGTPGTFSLQDLIDLQQGTLLTMLQDAAETSKNHIKKECMACLGKGFFCGLCSEKPLKNKKSMEGTLFIFDEAVSNCRKCSAVFHRTCWAKKEECPRCMRMNRRQGAQETGE